MIRSVRNSSIGFSKSTRNKPENQDKDAQGKIEQQQALSFGKCSQHEWGPQMMSKEKGTSIKVGTQIFKKFPIGDLGIGIPRTKGDHVG